jgi:hypothetical protein
MKKRTISFLISDFRDTDFEQTLKHAGRRHDLVALRVTDPLDRELPNVGWLPLQDPETSEIRWIQTSSKRSRKRHMLAEKEREAYLNSLFVRSGVDQAVLLTNKPFVQPLMQLFDRRG